MSLRLARYADVYTQGHKCARSHSSSLMITAQQLRRSALWCSQVLSLGRDLRRRRPGNSFRRSLEAKRCRLPQVLTVLSACLLAEQLHRGLHRLRNRSVGDAEADPWRCHIGRGRRSRVEARGEDGPARGAAAVRLGGLPGAGAVRCNGWLAFSSREEPQAPRGRARAGLARPCRLGRSGPPLAPAGARTPLRCQAILLPRPPGD